jgi:hypothetical protein
MAKNNQRSGARALRTAARGASARHHVRAATPGSSGASRSAAGRLHLFRVMARLRGDRLRGWLRS